MHISTPTRTEVLHHLSHIKYNSLITLLTTLSVDIQYISQQYIFVFIKVYVITPYAIAKNIFTGTA